MGPNLCAGVGGNSGLLVKISTNLSGKTIGKYCDQFLEPGDNMSLSRSQEKLYNFNC